MGLPASPSSSPVQRDGTFSGSGEPLHGWRPASGRVPLLRPVAHQGTLCAVPCCACCALCCTTLCPALRAPSLLGVLSVRRPEPAGQRTQHSRQPSAPARRRPQVQFQESRLSFLSFLTSLCAIIGGVFTGAPGSVGSCCAHARAQALSTDCHAPVAAPAVAPPCSERHHRRHCVPRAAGHEEEIGVGQAQLMARGNSTQLAAAPHAQPQPLPGDLCLHKPTAVRRRARGGGTMRAWQVDRGVTSFSACMPWGCCYRASAVQLQSAAPTESMGHSQVSKGEFASAAAAAAVAGCTQPRSQPKATRPMLPCAASRVQRYDEGMSVGAGLPLAAPRLARAASRAR